MQHLHNIIASPRAFVESIDHRHATAIHTHWRCEFVSVASSAQLSPPSAPFAWTGINSVCNNIRNSGPWRTYTAVLLNTEWALHYTLRLPQWHLLSVADLGRAHGEAAAPFPNRGRPMAVRGRYATVCLPPFNQPARFKNPGSATACCHRLGPKVRYAAVVGPRSSTDFRFLSQHRIYWTGVGRMET